MINPSFENTSALWVRYDKYEYKKDDKGVLYITPAPEAKPKPYNPMNEPEQLVIDFLNVGMRMMKREKEEEIKKAVLDFITGYGLLGFMTALPTTPEFIDYNAVYFPVNHFIKEETMSTEDYLDIFFPFEKLNFTKVGQESVWGITEDKAMQLLSMMFSGSPTAVNMGFQRSYAERYDWICKQFKDLAFSFLTPFLYYNDYDRIDETSRDLYRQGMAAFGGISPTYHIALKERPTLVWIFYSLLSCVQMMFTFMLTDEKHPLRPCKNCQNEFIPNRPNTLFCCPECKSKHGNKRKD
jgi:hypothetical protein